MTKRQLFRYRKRERELRVIDMQLSGGIRMVSDTVKASGREYPYLPYLATVKGVDTERASYLRFRRAYLRRRQKEVEQFIGGIDDEYMRGILWARYILGASWVQIGHAMCVTFESIKKTANRYLDSVCRP